VNGIHSYSCKCLTGYTGGSCETEISSKASTTTIASPTSNATRVTSSVKGSATSSSVTTQQPETTFVIELRIQRTWNDDLENENSQAFKELSQTLVIQISEQYSQEDNFVGTEILSFRPGSVVVEFQLSFKNKLEDDRALIPLKKAIQDGKLGPLTVDPESLKIKKDAEEPTKEHEGKVPYPIIIGVSCGGIFVLAVLSIYPIRRCHRRKVASRRHNSCGLPTEVAFPNSGKYELQETKSKEEIVRYEEIGMWKDTVCYEKLLVTQDAAEYEELDIPNVDGDYQEICISNDAERYQETSLLKKAGQK